MTHILITRSDYGMNSSHDDRISTLKPGKIASLAQEKGWDHVVLADERTMAGSLDFLEGCHKAKIKGVCALQLSKLRYTGGTTSIILMPLNEIGLHNLLKISDKLCNSHTIQDVYKNYQSIIQNDKASTIHTVLVFLPKETNNLIKIEDFKPLGISSTIGYGNCNHEEIRSYPQDQAKLFQEKTNLPPVSLQFGYLLKPISKRHLNGIASVLEATPVAMKLPMKERRPQVFLNGTIIEKNKDFIQERDKDDNTPISKNTLSIIDRIQNCRMKREPKLPKFPGHEKLTAIQQLQIKAMNGYKNRVENSGLLDNDIAKQRLEYELKTIETLGFADYFLIMEDAIGFAKEKNIAVGPGRGSAAGSLVAYCIGITNIDPMRFGLIFERFINPERVSLPDIDTDFCVLRRPEIIKHLEQRYGDENVAQIATYASWQPKAAILGAARALGMPQVGRRATKKSLGPKDDTLLDRLLVSEDTEEKMVAELAQELLGLSSHSGIHAGGVIVSDTPICHHAPIHFERSDMGRLVIGLDMIATENAGFVKLDILGLKTLTMLQEAIQDIQNHYIDVKINLNQIDETDSSVYKMIREGKTLGIFQIESPGMTRAAIDIQVDCLDDIIALVALYRPGPMEFIELYGKRKKKQEAVTYIDPCLVEIIQATQGIFIYQEQIMRMAQVYAGYTAPQADSLRKAIGKKILEAVQAEEKLFLKRALEQGRDPEISKKLFDHILPFARYGFNKSHAVAYGVLTYQTAWIKKHYTAAWLCACLNHEGDPEERVKIIKEAHRHNIEVILPDVNHSGNGYTWYKDENTGIEKIIIPINAIMGIGREAGQIIKNEFDKNGFYLTLSHFMERIDCLNRSQINRLSEAGALDSLTSHPKTSGRPQLSALAAELPLKRKGSENQKNQINLFETIEIDLKSDPEPRYKWQSISPERANYNQSIALQGLIQPFKSKSPSVEWRLDIENYPRLKQAVDMSKTMVCKTICTAIAAGERLIAAKDGGTSRILTVTLQDNQTQIKLDLADQAQLPRELNENNPLIVEIELKPGSGKALLGSMPEIMRIEICTDPKSEPRNHPVLTLQDNINTETRNAIRNVCRLAAGQKKLKETIDQSMKYLIVIPDSQETEIFPIGRYYDNEKLKTIFQNLGDKAIFLESNV